MRGQIRPLAIVLLFLSGAAALVYQTLWVKQLALVVGVDVYAVSTAVAAFFAGLALGSAMLGRQADRAMHPFALYAVLEVGVALLGVGATLALAHSPRLQASVAPWCTLAGVEYGSRRIDRCHASVSYA